MRYKSVTKQKGYWTLKICRSWMKYILIYGVILNILYMVRRIIFFFRKWRKCIPVKLWKSSNKDDIFALSYPLTVLWTKVKPCFKQRLSKIRSRSAIWDRWIIPQLINISGWIYIAFFQLGRYEKLYTDSSLMNITREQRNSFNMKFSLKTMTWLIMKTRKIASEILESI